MADERKSRLRRVTHWFTPLRVMAMSVVFTCLSVTVSVLILVSGQAQITEAQAAGAERGKSILELVQIVKNATSADAKKASDANLAKAIQTIISGVDCTVAVRLRPGLEDLVRQGKLSPDDPALRRCP